MIAEDVPPLLLSVSEALTALLGARLRVTTTEAGEVCWTIGRGATFRLSQLTNNGEVPAEGSLANTVWVASYVPETLAAQLRQRGYCYADAAGNAWIEDAAANLLVLVQGRARPKNPEVTVFQGGFYAHGLLLLYHLLTNPAMLTYSEAALAKRTNVPLPRLRNILHDLEQQGHLTPAPNRQLVDRPELLAQWTAAYNKRLRPRLNPIRYRWLPNTGEWPDAQSYQAAEVEGAWGGELAAHLLLETNQPGRITSLYYSGDRTALCARLGLARHSKGTVQILNLFVPPDYTLRSGRVCVHPLLVYADLLQDEEAQSRLLAEQLHARFLAEEPAPKEGA